MMIYERHMVKQDRFRLDINRNSFLRDSPAVAEAGWETKILIPRSFKDMTGNSLEQPSLTSQLTLLGAINWTNNLLKFLLNWIILWPYDLTPVLALYFLPELNRSPYILLISDLAASGLMLLIDFLSWPWTQLYRLDVQSLNPEQATVTSSTFFFFLGYHGALLLDGESQIDWITEW